MKSIFLVLCLSLCGCSTYGLVFGRYYHVHKSHIGRRPTVGYSDVIDINQDSTYTREYGDSARNRWYSQGTWSITYLGQLSLWDTMSPGRISSIIIDVEELDNNVNDSITFRFNPDLEPGFWRLIVNDVMYTISDKTINIPGDTDLKHFCLIGFKEEYEYLNAVNYVVKTELYEVKDKNKRMFDVKLPDYAKDFNIMYYKPETFSFKIKNKKLKGPRVKYELRE